MITSDIQTAHDRAVAAGEPGYIDPHTGLFVLTVQYLAERGQCCSNRCRHCPCGDAMKSLVPGVGPEDDIDPGTLVLDESLVLPSRIVERARIHPTRVFMTDVGGRSVNYGEFRDEMSRWCRVLGDLGVRRGDRVASMLPSSIDGQVVWMAVACVGAIEVPVSPDLRGESLRHVLVDAGVRVCLTRPEFVELLASSGVDGLDIVPVPRDASILNGVSPGQLTLPLPSDVSCVIYTSGTTGASKGVMIAWGQLTGIIGRVPRSWFTTDDVAYVPWPIFHITGRSPLVNMLDCGGELVLRERFSVSEFWSDIRRHNVTTTTVGSMTRLLLAEPESPTDRDHPLRFVMGAIQDLSALRFQERFGVPIIGAYGSTEIGFPIVHRSLNADTVGITGWPRPGYDVKVTDENGVDVAPDQPGELWIRPSHPLLRLVGYLNRPDLTDHALVDGWYRTGDGFTRSADGTLRFTDRLKDTIRRFGENISATAIESVVVNDHEIIECAAVAVANDICGAEVLIAVVPAAGVVLDPASFYQRLFDQLPLYARPAFIAVVAEFAKTPNGKIRKVGLDGLAAGAWRSPAAVVKRHRS